MTNDLISRSQLLKTIAEYDKEILVPANWQEALKRAYIDDFKDMINEQPTAYDVDKVIDELEEMSAMAEIGDNKTDAIAYEIAIDIVKKYDKEKNNEDFNRKEI